MTDAAPDRRNYDDLEFDDQLALREGRPFTGTVFSLHANGALEYEGSYVDGLPSGVQEERFPDGNLAKRWIAMRGRGVIESWEWWESGGLRSHHHYVDQSPAKVRRWDEKGNPVGERPCPAGESSEGQAGTNPASV